MQNMLNDIYSAKIKEINHRFSLLATKLNKDKKYTYVNEIKAKNTIQRATEIDRACKINQLIKRTLIYINYSIDHI